MEIQIFFFDLNGIQKLRILIFFLFIFLINQFFFYFFFCFISKNIKKFLFLFFLYFIHLLWNCIKRQRLKKNEMKMK